MDKFYYIKIDNPHNILEADTIAQLVGVLYEGARYISDSQIVVLKLDKNYVDKLKKKIATYEDRIPLYDIVSNKVFLVFKENIYDRIYNDNYRFLDKKYIDQLIKSKPKNGDAIEIENREIIRIYSNYDQDTLRQTYLKQFHASFILENNFSNCKRPSFSAKLDHIKPYYSIHELYYLAIDWNLIKLEEKLDIDKIEEKLCDKIASFDIPAAILLSHQMYIHNLKAIGIIKHYSLFGSYYINNYLRFKPKLRNEAVETQIELMNKVVKAAPAFTLDHTVYRFVESDSYIAHLKVGDVYVDPSFMSTTRNLFYYDNQENYQFGFIQLKIKIPKDIKGAGLCIETYSNFPKEEEIILPPRSRFRLTNFTENQVQHAVLLTKKSSKTYEFVLEPSDESISYPSVPFAEKKLIDLKTIVSDENFYGSITDRLQYFIRHYCNLNKQFEIIVNKHMFLFNFESYDSRSVYKDFFYYQTTNGMMLYSFNPNKGNINILIEIGPEIHINYYFKYAVSENKNSLNLSNEGWIESLSMFAYIIGCREVVFHSNYLLKGETIESTRYTYSDDIYIYLKDGTKLFEFEGITTNFDYYQLDRLGEIKPKVVLNERDKDPLFGIYLENKSKNLKDFYLFIADNYPKLLPLLEKKFDLIYTENENPFKRFTYSLDSFQYLFNKSIINRIPEVTEQKGQFRTLIGEKKVQQFKNRLRTFLQK